MTVGTGDGRTSWASAPPRHRCTSSPTRHPAGSAHGQVSGGRAAVPVRPTAPLGAGLLDAALTRLRQRGAIPS